MIPQGKTVPTRKVAIPSVKRNGPTWTENYNIYPVNEVDVMMSIMDKTVPTWKVSYHHPH